MPIKKSYLEQKWPYRLVKVILLLLPLLLLFLALISLLNGKINICAIPLTNIYQIFQKYIVYIAIGLILYYLILNGLWKLILYVIYGGLEDDGKKVDSDQSAPIKPKQNIISQLIPFIMLLVVLVIFALSEMGYITLPKISLTPSESPRVKSNPGPVCYATSAQWGTPCKSVKNGVGVSGVIVPNSCNCPNDTSFAQMDNTAPGGPYKICKCK